MTPSDFTHALATVNERLQSVRTAALSMLMLAALALAGAYGVSAVQPRLARIVAALAVAGALGAIGASRLLAWRRDELYDDILLSGFRHVGGPGVARRSSELVSSTTRRELATTLERFAQAAAERQPAAVPLDRPGLIELRPQVLQLVEILRADTPVEPVGMVLVRRLVTDGSESPLFHVVTGSRDLERALVRIQAELVPEHGAHDLPVAA